MAHPLAHEQRVEAWSAALAGAPASAHVEVLARTVAAIWRRAQRTLGDVTVRTIARRVVRTVAARHPLLDAVDVGDDAIELDTLRAAVTGGGVGVAEVRAAGAELLVELLTVLGDLTGGALTPALHAELVRGEPFEGAADTAAGASAPAVSSWGDEVAHGRARGGRDEVNETTTNEGQP